MAHKCFISFKKEDQWYRNKIDNLFSASDIINKGLDRVIDSNDGDYIMKTIRQDYLKDSTVTVFLIGTHSAENEGCDYWGRRKNYFIERELQASLFNGEGNTRNGILGVVLPEMCDQIYKGTYQCQKCNGTHSYVAINDSTVIREFSVNYYMYQKSSSKLKPAQWRRLSQRTRFLTEVHSRSQSHLLMTAASKSAPTAA